MLLRVMEHELILKLLLVVMELLAIRGDSRLR